MLNRSVTSACSFSFRRVPEKSYIYIHTQGLDADDDDDDDDGDDGENWGCPTIGNIRVVQGSCFSPFTILFYLEIEGKTFLEDSKNVWLLKTLLLIKIKDG